MTRKNTKADLFQAMGLGPVWELKDTPQQQAASASQASIPAKPMIGLDELDKQVSHPLISLAELHEQVRNCNACGLCDGRKQVVFSDGVENSSLMVVGEAPGAEEDASGLPFVGRAGQLLDKMLTAVGSSRKKNVYIANVLKCRPPGNRNPEAAEIEQCLPHLVQQIRINQPKMLLLVGKFAIQALLETGKPVGEMRGKVHRVQLAGLDIPAVATYHPAYLLRRPEEKSKAWDDLLLLKQQAY
jgi:uracil-DNA glycosylase